MLELRKDSTERLFMKKLIFIASLVLLLATVTGCGEIDNLLGKTATLGDKADEVLSTYEGAEMKYISSASDSLTVKITNGTASTWQSGNMRDYRLEAQRDGEWYEVTQIGEFANTMELMIFAPGESMTHTFNFKDRYGALPAGRYRVVKSYWANKTDTTEAGEFFLSCEFLVK